MHGCGDVPVHVRSATGAVGTVAVRGCCKGSSCHWRLWRLLPPALVGGQPWYSPLHPLPAHCHTSVRCTTSNRCPSALWPTRHATELLPCCCPAATDYNDLMDMTEKMVAQMVFEIKGSYKISYHANGPDQPPVDIDFSPPWRRISMVRCAAGSMQPCCTRGPVPGLCAAGPCALRPERLLWLQCSDGYDWMQLHTIQAFGTSWP